MTQALAAYDKITAGRTRFVRVDDLCARAAAAFAGLVPSPAQLAEEAPRLQAEKKGLEKAQGEFLAAILSNPATGLHLCHAMLLPREDSLARLPEYEKSGVLDLGTARLQRQGKAAVVTMTNPRYLNAEDETTLAPLETVIDVALLDAKSEVCVLRGGP